MKSLLFISASLALCSVARSQVVADAMGDEFKEVSKFGARQSGFEGIQTYHSNNVEGSQFFSPNWASGTVTTINNEKIGKNYLFLYDKVRQELFMKWKDSSFILLADKNQVSAFTLNTDRTHTFVAAGSYDPSNKGNYFEVLVKSDKGYSLLKLIKTKFVKGDERDIEKQRLGEIYDSFQDQVTYYIVANGTIQPVTLRKANILKVLAPVRGKASEYFDQHDNSALDESFLTGLVESINE
jgi:hypothetical protein